MDILYLHGLLSNNQSPKVDWLRESHNVFNPKLDYKNNGEILFSELEQLIKENGIELIIGSSMGGFLGFHLANKLNIPTLLFNPALNKKSELKPKVDSIQNLDIKHTLVLGEMDDIVIPESTLEFLNKNKFNYIHTFENNGHRTPFDVFKKHADLLKVL